MSLTLEQLVESLVESGLLSRDQVAAVCDQVAAGPSADDAQSVLRKLVDDHQLTTFQARAVWAGKASGLTFDEYVILDKIGAGGMGVVFQARHRRMDRIVAAKKLAAAAMAAPGAVDRFYREVKAAARLAHPNIVTAYDAREHKGSHYLIMEFVDGRDLAAIVKQQGPLPVDQAVDYMIQAAGGLDYAHGMGIVHRDVKPGNLLLSTNGERPQAGGGREPTDLSTNQLAAASRSPSDGISGPAVIKILDMGLARIKDDASTEEQGPERLTSSGQVMGTCDYMAPEQAEDSHKADQRADIYSLGCTLYRLLADRPPYRGQSLMNVLIAHREQPTPSLADERPDVPQALSDICLRMMAKRSDDRYQSMGDVIAALTGLQSGEPTPPPPPAPPDPDSKLTGFLSQMGPDDAPQAAAPPVGEAVLAGQPVVATEGTPAGSTEELAGLTMAHATPPAGASPVSVAAGGRHRAPHAPRRGATARRRQQTWMLLWIGIGLGISLVGAVLVAVVFNAQTADGTIVVQPQGHESRVVVNRDEAPVGTISAENDWRLEVEPGVYELVIEDDEQELRPDPGTVEVTSREVTTVRVVPTVSPPPPDPAVSPPAPVPPPVASSVLPGMRAVDAWALDFDGQSSFIRVPSLKYAGTGPLTIEAYVMPRQTNNAIVAIARGLPSGYAKLAMLEKGWHAAIHQNGFLKTATSWDGPVVNRRVHVALVWDGQMQGVYVDGLQSANKQGDQPLEDEPGEGTFFGAFEQAGPLRSPFDGQIDQIRFSNTARYRKRFWPSEDLEADAQTMALYRFDEGKGTVLGDSSGNQHHGTIVGAKWVRITKHVHDPTNDRRAALWAIGLGGHVGIWDAPDEGNRRLAKPSDLPREPFRLFSVSLTTSTVTDEQLAEMPPVPYLNQLHLNTSSVTNVGLAHLPRLPKLELLQLSGSGVTDAGLAELKKFPELQSLLLARTAVGDAGMVHLSQLPNRDRLRNFDLEGSKVTDQGLATLASMPNVRDLWLMHTSITDTGLRHLQSARNLEMLDVHNTRVTAAAVAELKRARPACDVQH